MEPIVQFELKEGTLYPVLYRLEDQGWIEPEWEQPKPGAKRGVPRKYYRLTAPGKEQLAQLKREWKSFAGSVNDLLA